MGNVVLKDQICEEYCAEECKTCNETRTDCYECSDFYKMDENGKCVLKSDLLNVGLKFYTLANFIRRRGMKALLFVIDNLWLSNFHQQEFDGTTKSVFEASSFCEEKKWEIVRL